MESYQKQILVGEAMFEDLAKKYSDCNSARQGGDLGVFGPNKMQPAFEKARY